MATIRRYGSRKLYDPGDSRYVSLDEIAERVRRGEQIEVLDNATGGDVTAQTLVQVLLEGERSGRSRLPAELLHDLVRVAGRRVPSSATQLQAVANRLLRASLERLAPVREARRDAARVEQALRHLEGALEPLDRRSARPGAGAKGAASAPRRAPARGRRPKPARKRRTAKRA